MIHLLLTDLKRYLEERLAGEAVVIDGQSLRKGGLVLPGADRDEHVPPEAHLGFLPHKRPEKEAYPFVIIRWHGGRDDEEAYNESVYLVVGVFGREQDEMHHHGLNLLFAVRQALRERRVLGGWALELPVESKEDEEPRYPYALAVVETTWRKPAPEHIPEEDFYGQE